MAPRNRSYQTSTFKGRVVTNGVLVAGGHDVVEDTGFCGDQTGPGDCAPFNVKKVFLGGGRVDVHNNANNYWENYRVDFLDVTSFDHLGPLLGQDRSNADYATQAAARTNPSRPYVDIPVNILELGGLTRKIYDTGRNAYQHFANANLAYQYGIAPLVGDLVKLTNFQDQLSRRMGEIGRLASSTGLRRTVSVGGWSRVEKYNAVMQSNQYFWTDEITQTTVESIKVHCRWLPEASFSSIDPAGRERLAMRSLLGLTLDHSTLWEAMPWSWLIDWAGNVGDYFKANRNLIPATLSGVHVMRETMTTHIGKGVSFGAAGKQSPVNVKVISKSRAPSFVAPIAHFPFLSGNQMGILASLAVTRM
jgi:hypothetical protein